MAQTQELIITIRLEEEPILRIVKQISELIYNLKAIKAELEKPVKINSKVTVEKDEFNCPRPKMSYQELISLTHPTLR